MTDTSQTIVSKEGIGKSSLDIILRMIAQNVTPAIVGILCAKLPLLQESTWYEITVFILAAFGNIINKATPDSLWTSLKDVILWFRRGMQTVRKATDEPLP